MLKEKNTISPLLFDDYNLLSRYVEGKRIIKIKDCTETHISLLLEDGILLDFLYLEDEVIFDIETP